MTNKEYIRWLKLLDEELPFDGLIDGKDEMDMHEMIWELCEKLEQEPCEDCISRAEAMTEIMMFAGNVKSDEEDIYIKVSDAVQLLRELPSVTPKLQMVQNPCVECGCNYCTNDDCENRYIVDIAESEDKECR